MGKKTTDPRPASGLPAGRGPDAVVAVPTRWLWSLAALIVVPWLAAAGVYLAARSPSPVASGPATVGLTPARARGQLGRLGPWGQLERVPIVISPPLELVPEDREPPRAAEWHLPVPTAEKLAATLAAAGLDAATRQRLLASARAEDGGFRVSPEGAVVRALDPATRGSLYSALAVDPRNERQLNAYRFFGSPETWFHEGPVSAATLGLVRPYLYQLEGFSYFADIDLVRGQIRDEEELRRLTKLLFRESTLLVKVHIPPGSAVDGIAEYWGRGGRTTDVRPLLESVAQSGDELDVSHLLPPFAREHLYHYPQLSLADFDKPALGNCFWTAFNFLAERPDDRLLDFKYVLATLKRDYVLIQAEQRFGDLVMFSDADAGERYYHAAVYLADGLVFGKTGLSPLSPWTILPIDRIKGYYLDHANTRIEYFRRKGQ